jgi:signal transduction histidine kinase
LGAISNYAAGCAMMVRDNSPNRDELLDIMDKIAGEARRAGRVIRRTRRFVGRRDRELADVNLNDTVREVIELLAHETSTEGITVTAKLTDPPPLTSGDSVLLQQVVTNLLKNAVDALRDANIENPAVTIHTRHIDPDKIEVDVSDNGPGLTPDQFDRVFDPYYTTRDEGLGLGLAICRSIIDEHGGRLLALDHPPRGTTFRFQLPSNG